MFILCVWARYINFSCSSGGTLAERSPERAHPGRSMLFPSRQRAVAWDDVWFWIFFFLSNSAFIFTYKLYLLGRKRNGLLRGAENEGLSEITFKNLTIFFLTLES